MDVIIQYIFIVFGLAILILASLLMMMVKIFEISEKMSVEGGISNKDSCPPFTTIFPGCFGD